MMAYESSKSAQDSFGKYIYQFQLETKTIIRKLGRILIKLCRQNVSLLFNQTYLNERLLSNYTHTHTHVCVCIYIIIIMSRRQRGYPWPSLAISPYHSSPPAGLQGYILCPHIVAVCMFVLVVPLLHIHMWGSTGVHRLWARPCFSSSDLRVWFVELV